MSNKRAGMKYTDHISGRRRNIHNRLFNIRTNSAILNASVKITALLLIIINDGRLPVHVFCNDRNQ